MTSKKPILPTKLKFEIIKLSRLMATLKLLPSLVIAKNRGKKSFIPLAKNNEKVGKISFFSTKAIESRREKECCWHNICPLD